MVGAFLHRTVVDKQAKKEHPDVPKVKAAIRPHYKQVPWKPDCPWPCNRTSTLFEWPKTDEDGLL